MLKRQVSHIEAEYQEAIKAVREEVDLQQRAESHDITTSVAAIRDVADRKLAGLSAQHGSGPPTSEQQSRVDSVLDDAYNTIGEVRGRRATATDPMHWESQKARLQQQCQHWRDSRIAVAQGGYASAIKSAELTLTGARHAAKFGAVV